MTTGSPLECLASFLRELGDWRNAAWAWRVVLTTLVLGRALGGCAEPEVDQELAPPPRGVLRGTVTYIGPKPPCVLGIDSFPIRIPGIIVLTLFEFDNPPPPSGSASSASNLLAIPGEKLFEFSDCRVDPNDTTTITRSLDFAWPDLPLSSEPCTMAEFGPVCPEISYMIRGFYDSDGDFNPFFSSRRQPTAGDVGGGALVDLAASPPQFRPITFGNVMTARNGQVVEGVTVTLASPVITEQTPFEIIEAKALSSAATIPPIPDPLQREQALVDLIQTRISGIVDAETGMPSPLWLRALEAGGVDSTNMRAGRPQYGFYVLPVDANSDGQQDPHPVLGGAGVPWATPIILLRRAKSPAERALGLPDIAMVGSIRPSAIATGRKEFDSFELIVPPVAVAVTNPAEPAVCRVTIAAPGNIPSVFGSGWTDCQELPSGNFDVNVLNGVAGARPVNELMRCVASCQEDGTSAEECMTSCGTSTRAITDNTWSFDSGSYSGQAWSVPNELGCPDTSYNPAAVNQLDPPNQDGSFPQCGQVVTPGQDPVGENPAVSALIASQGRAGSLSVVGNTSASASDPKNLTDGRGIPICTTFLTGDPVVYTPPSATAVSQCCPASVLQFCGLPLCPLRDGSLSVPADPTTGTPAGSYPGAVRDLDGSRRTRELRVPGEDYVYENGRIVPRCTPFHMPVACCTVSTGA